MKIVISIMGLSESKPWQFSLRDIFEKVRCYSSCCGGRVIIEEHDESDGEDCPMTSDTDNDESTDVDSDTEDVDTLD